MPFRPREVESKLQGKFGFSSARGHSSKHRWYELSLPGLPVILTKVSHSRRPLTPPIERSIAHQCRVRVPFFRGMMDCSNEREDYYRQVLEAPYPPFSVRVV